MNGAARRAAVDDRVIICAYMGVTQAEAAAHNPNLVYIDANNDIALTSKGFPLQEA